MRSHIVVVYCAGNFLVINGESNRKVIENYLLLLGSVFCNYLLHAITLKIGLLPITFLLPITYYPMSGGNILGKLSN